MLEKNRALGQRVAELEEGEAELHNALAYAEDEKMTLQRRVQELAVDAGAEVQKQLANVQNENAMLRRRVEELEASAEKKLKDELRDVEHDLESARASEARMREESKIRDEAVYDMERIITEQSQQLTELEAQLAAVQEAMHEAERERDSAEEQCRALEDSLTEGNQTKDFEDANSRAVAEERDRTRQLYEESVSSVHDLQERLAEVERALERTRGAALEDTEELQEQLGKTKRKLLEV